MLQALHSRRALRSAERNSLAGEGDVDSDAVVAVGGGIAGVGHKGRVGLMVHKRRERDALAQLITSHEVDRECARSLRGLREGRLDATDQTLVLRVSKVEIQSEVVANIALLATNLQDLVEVGNLISGANLELAAVGLHKLSG